MAIASRTAAPVAAKPTAAKPTGGAPVKPSASAALQATAQMHEAVMKVETTILEGGTIKGEPVVKETREVKVFVTNPAHVSVNLGYNKNLGNIEMAKIGVMVSMPCYVEEFQSAKEQVLDMAKALLEQAIGEINLGEPAVGAEDLSGEPAAEETATAAEESGDLTPEALAAYTLEQLTELANANPDLGVTPSDYTSEEDLREVLASVCFPAEEAATGTEEAAPDQYTEEQLMDDAVTKEDLMGIFEAWEMGKYPPGPAAIAKKTAVRKILEKQAAALASAQAE